MRGGDVVDEPRCVDDTTYQPRESALTLVDSL